MEVTCRSKQSNHPSPIGPMPKKTTDKKPADKKDAGKKPNTGKDAGDSKVRRFALVRVDLCPMDATQGGGKLKAATSINVRHILCEVRSYLRRQTSSPLKTFPETLKGDRSLDQDPGPRCCSILLHL